MFCQNGGRHSPHAGRDRSNAAYNGFYIVKFHIAAQFSVLANVDPHIYDCLLYTSHRKGIRSIGFQEQTTHDRSMSMGVALDHRHDLFPGLLLSQP